MLFLVLAVADYLTHAKIKFDKRYDTPDNNKVTINDFDCKRTLGSGSFGRVILVQHLGDKNFYAMKILDKHRVWKAELFIIMTKHRVWKAKSFIIMTSRYHRRVSK